MGALRRRLYAELDDPPRVPLRRPRGGSPQRVAEATRALGFVLPPMARRLPGCHDPAFAGPRGLPEAQAIEVDEQPPVILHPCWSTFRQYLESAVSRAPVRHHTSPPPLSPRAPRGMRTTPCGHVLDRTRSLRPLLRQRSSVFGQSETRKRPRSRSPDSAPAGHCGGSQTLHGL